MRGLVTGFILTWFCVDGGVSPLERVWLEDGPVSAIKAILTGIQQKDSSFFMLPEPMKLMRMIHLHVVIENEEVTSLGVSLTSLHTGC